MSWAVATVARLQRAELRRAAARHALTAAARIVAAEARLPVEAVLAPRGHGRAAWRARQRAAYLAVVVGDVPAHAVAAAAGIDEKSVRKALAVVEDARDRPDVERRLARMETRLERRIA